MPEVPGCHITSIAVAYSASTVRDLGFAGAVSAAAAPTLGIAYKRGHFDAPVARSAGSELSEQSAAAVRAEGAHEGGDR